jgi:hypothetical protein
VDSGGSKGIYLGRAMSVGVPTSSAHGNNPQANVANAADAGYENIPANANRRDNFAEHECSMTEKKSVSVKDEVSESQ